MKQNLDTKVKHISLLILKISFLTLHQINPIFGYRVKEPQILKKIFNPFYGCGVKIAPYINPIYAGLEKSCPRDSKNVLYVDVGLV